MISLFVTQRLTHSLFIRMFKCSNVQTFKQFKAFEEWQTSLSVVGKEEVEATSTSSSTSTSSGDYESPKKPVVKVQVIKPVMPPGTGVFPPVTAEKVGVFEVLDV
jgi:hypothetical protein